MKEDSTKEAEDTGDERDIISEAHERWERAENAYRTTRQLAIADTQFAMGDSDNMWQWPQEVSSARIGDRRVCLTINLTAQHCNQIINQIRQNRPSCRVMPVDDFSDKKTAEILAGLIRNIQSTSNADDAHDIAAEHAIYGGEGYWRVLTEYETVVSRNQVIKIKSIPNPFLVFIDPDAIEPDKSDAEWGFIFEDVKKETIEREYPELKDDISSWSTEKKNTWVTDDTVRIAEYYCVEYVKDKALYLADGTDILESKLGEDITRDGMTLTNTQTGQTIEIVGGRDTFRKQWKWYKLIGKHTEPVDSRDWPGEYLPIISIVGKEVNVNGEIIRKGIVRDLKDPARMTNYAYSETVQAIALQNKIPYLAAGDAIEGYENDWAMANMSNKAYLPYNAYDDEGQPLPKPERQQPAVMPAAQIQLLQLSSEEMRAASGQQNANFGIKSEASSGVGIQRLKAQGEIATFHFPDNLARGLKYEAVVLIDLIQKVYDTKRVVRVLGFDGNMEHAILDPNHPQSYGEQQTTADDIQKIFNPSLGQYDVVIDTGPSFQTQRQEGYASMMELASRSPQLMQIAGDIIMRNADYPGAEKIADRLAKALPPQLQEQKGGTEQQLAKVSQQAQQMQQQMQMMSQQLQETQAKLQQAESGAQKTQLEMQYKMQLAEFESQVEEQKQVRALEAEFRLEAYRAQLEDQRRQREIASEMYQSQMDAKMQHDSEAMQIAGDLARSHQESCKEVQITDMNNKSREDIADLSAYVELTKAGMENVTLSADVNQDLKDERNNA
jgi:hypothetical protein